jgi:anti-sigma factor RsiW
VNCDDVRIDLGAYVLGALEPDERRRVDEHLRDCPPCAAEYEELWPLPGMLGRVDPDDLQPVTVTPSADLFARMSAAAVGEQPAHRLRSRTWALVAAVVLAVLGVGAAITVWVTGTRGQTASASAGPVHVTVTATEADDGTALDVTVAGLRPKEICTLVAVDRDGKRHDAGDWPVSDGGDGQWVGWADVDLAALAGAIILGDGGRELARVTF